MLLLLLRNLDDAHILYFCRRLVMIPLFPSIAHTHTHTSHSISLRPLTKSSGSLPLLCRQSRWLMGTLFDPIAQSSYYYAGGRFFSLIPPQVSHTSANYRRKRAVVDLLLCCPLLLYKTSLGSLSLSLSLLSPSAAPAVSSSRFIRTAAARSSTRSISSSNIGKHGDQQQHTSEGERESL